MKYALLGYTYQHYVASLLLAMMDVERKIQKIGLEVDVDHKFDDLAIESQGENYFIQIKDIEGVNLNDLDVTADEIIIKGKPHKLSKEKNLLFFKDIRLRPDCKILGFPAKQKDGIYIISLSRVQIEQRITRLYRIDPHRRQLMNRFLSEKLDNRKLDMELRQLPAITTFDTRLSDQSIRLARKILDFEQLLHIEGKPGVGKSHLVSQLQKQFSPYILYRFWISNQDRYYEERLKYDNFRVDLIKKLFFDQKERSEKDILDNLERNKPTLILDGLDHIENYRPEDLQSYINFINNAAEKTRVIVLSRPLREGLKWKKQILRNWNFPQTKRILKLLYQITEYQVAEQLYKLTDGYPILVRYIAEQYKKEGIVPPFAALETVNAYYDGLFVKQTGKRALTLFLCNRGFIMSEEIDMLLGEYSGSLIREFIDERPYLFECKLNRITLYHDSLITYLRNSGIEYTTLQQKVNGIVSASLLKGETRFQSRIGHFDLSKESAQEIVKYYSSIDNFKEMMRELVDFEAVREFYPQLLEMQEEIEPSQLTIRQYYDLALILNITARDHLSTLNGFYYVLTSALLREGYGQEHITSSGYLFGMLMYIKTQDASLLYNVKAEGLFDTSRFYRELENEVEEEISFFDYQSRPFEMASIKKALADSRGVNYGENLERILVNLYLHPQPSERFAGLREAVIVYLDGEETIAARRLRRLLGEKDWEDHRFIWRLSNVKAKLLALGALPENNDYLKLLLEEYLAKHGNKGSFTLWPEVLAFIRLRLHQERNIDLGSISAFLVKYYQRHDYSLRSIYYVLAILEKHGRLEWKDAVSLISNIQQISEKGYRGLTADYLSEHETDFMLDAVKEFGYGQLRVSWFLMDKKYIDALPKYIYDLEIEEQLHYHRDRREMEISVIEGLFGTSKFKYLKNDLAYHGYSIAIKAGDPREALLKRHKISYKIQAGEAYKPERSAEERFNEGMFDEENRHLVLKRGLNPVETTLLHEVDYTALSYPEIFEVFDKKIVHKQLKQIFKAALTGKSKYGVRPQSPRLLPGTMLKVMEISGYTDFDEIFESFKLFMELSMYPVPISPPKISQGKAQ